MVSFPHSSQLLQKQVLFTGDKIKVSAKFISPGGFNNFNNFSQELYLKSQSLHNRAYTKSPALIQKLRPGKYYNLFRLVSKVRNKFQQMIERHFSDPKSETLTPQGAVLEALLIGERERLPETVISSLQNAGLFHLFAISGAHIAIISFLLFFLFKAIRIPTRVSYGLLMIVIIFFVLLVEGRPSVLRAAIMTLAFLLGKLLWKSVNLINTISISAFFLLLFNPFSLFSAGFQLTFAATFSIILFYPRIIKYLPKLPLRISEIFALSLSAQIGVLPIIALTFNRVTLSALLLNFAAIPLIGLIMASGYTFLLLSFVLPQLSAYLAEAIGLFIDILISLSHILDNFGFLSYRIPTPYGITVIGYIFFLLLFLLPVRKKIIRWLFSAGFLIFLIILITYPFSSTSKNLKVTFIDVGQGDSILVEFPGRKKMLIDGGGTPQGNFNIGERVVSPFLWDKGIKKIDIVVLTHAHPDHMNGLRAVVRNFGIGEFWEAYSPKNNRTYEAFRKFIPLSAEKKRYFMDHKISMEDIKIEVLFPPETTPYTLLAENDHSLVIKLTYGQTSFLFTGDISQDVESEISQRNTDIHSSVLKAPHHGSRFSSSMDFLLSVNPEIIIITAGKGNVYGLPNPEVLERYQNIGAEIYRTDVHGAIELTSNGKTLTIRTAVAGNW
jgi:competence protein ComEC